MFQVRNGDGAGVEDAGGQRSQQRRAQQRLFVLGEEQVRHEAVPVVMAAAQGDVEIGMLVVDDGVRGRQPQLDAGMAQLEARQPRQHLAAPFEIAGEQDLGVGARGEAPAARLQLAAQYPELWLVIIGTTVGMLIANVPVVLAGNFAADKLPLTLIRPANVYGLGGSSAWGDRLLAAFTASGGAVFGQAEQNDAGLVHVENLADALFLAGTCDAAIGRTYNVCDENGVTWRRFSDDMAAIAGKPPPPTIGLTEALAIVNANEDPANMIEPKDPNLPSMEGLNLVGYDNRIDSSRIREELGWSPIIGYSEAMNAIARDWRKEHIG